MVRAERGEPVSYLYGLDVVRFGAALMVCVFHLTWLDPALAGAAWFGWIGVQIFFVLSGLVIARSVAGRSAWSFVRARALRLYPAAWICAAISLLPLLAQQRMNPADPVSAAGMAERFVRSMLLVPPGPFLVTALWTLPVELAFYALVAVLIAAGAARRLSGLALVLAWASASYLLAFGAQQFHLVDGPSLDFGYGLGLLTLLRHGVFFAIGILIWTRVNRRLSLAETIGLVVAGGAGLVEIGCRAAEIAALSPARPALGAVWAMAGGLWLICCLAFLVSIRFAAPLSRLPARVRGAIRLAGLATYPLYLLHEAVGRVPKVLAAKLNLPPALGAGMGALASILVAVLVARWAEPWLRGRLQRLGVRRGGAVPAGTQAVRAPTVVEAG